MPKKLPIQVKAYKELPYEAKFQVDNVLSDDGLTIEDVNLKYLLDDVPWTIERLSDGSWDDNRSMATRQQNACRRWLKRWTAVWEQESQKQSTE